MGIAVGQHTHVQGTVSAASANTPSITTTVSGSTFVVAGALANKTGVLSASDSLNTGYVQIRTTLVSATASLYEAGWFYKENGTGGAGHNATISTTVNGLITAYLVEITGGATSGIKDQDVAGLEDTLSPYTTNTTGTTAQANELALAFYATDVPSGTGTITWGGGFSNVDQDANSSFQTAGIGSQTLAATGTVQGSITATGSNGALGFVATFKEAAAVSGVSNFVPMPFYNTIYIQE